MGSDDLFKKAKALREFRRRVGTKGRERARILIVCEGEKTEPNYFEGFRLTNVTVKGTGYNTDSLVQKALLLKATAIRDKEKYDQVWCVFDRDRFSAESFNSAFILAQDHDIKVAYSNEAFELWYLLHFNYYDTALSRDQYIIKLSQLLGHPYCKNSTSTFDELFDRQNDAIRNAKYLLDQYTELNPEKDNPSTTVHVLVEELREWTKH